MAKVGFSARGERVDFDILAIKQALASAPIAISTEQRREFIDTKNGIKPKAKTALKVIEKEIEKEIVPPTFTADALNLALESAASQQEEVLVVKKK